MSDNASGIVRILGGTVRATGGYNGAGIGGGNGGAAGRIDVYDALVDATGGTGAAGIGGGYKGTAGHFFNYGGTVWAKGGAGDGATPDIGRGKDSSSSTTRRFYVSGGSTTLANGYVTGMMTPSNATARVSRTVTANLDPYAAYVFTGLPDEYGQRLIIADAKGEVHLWLPNGDYAYSGGEIDYTVAVTGGKTTATGSSDYGKWLKKNGFLDHDLPTSEERITFDTQATPSAKRRADGSIVTVRDEYVAGTNPEDKDDVFTAGIEIGPDGEAVVVWTPDLNEGGAKSVRKYTVLGTENLGGDWHERQSADRFFKVEVSMP